MKLINCKNKKEHLNKLFELVEVLYGKYPLFLENKKKSLNRDFSLDNPFLRFGDYKNFLLLNDKDKSLAHISAIIDKRLPSEVGLIGHFESLNKEEYSKIILKEAISYLLDQNKKVIKGPIDFNTWQNFRFSFPEKNKPFFMEPFTRSYYSRFFEEYGFSTVQNSISSIQEVDNSGLRLFQKDFDKIIREGFIFERIESKNFLSVMPDIYKIIKESFKDTWAFIDISFDEFLYSFKDFVGIIDKSNTYVVRSPEGKIVSFCFAFPDFYSLPKIKRIILKTFAVLTEYQGLGIGSAMFYNIYKIAKEKGFSEFIFSTMRSENDKIFELTEARVSKNIYREYKTYELNL